MIHPICGILLLLSLAGVAGAQTAPAPADPPLDFTRYHNYAWTERIVETPAGQTAVDRRLFEAMLTAALDRRLKEKGFQLAAAGVDADLLLRYHAALEVGTSTQSLDPGGPTQKTKIEPVWTITRIRTMLDLEMIEGRDNRQVWRGNASAVFDSRQQEKELGKLARKLLKKFPPKK